MSQSEVEAFCQRGRDALNERDHAEATDAFECALELDPDCIEAYEGLATVSFLDQDLQSAIKHYSKLTLLKPSEGHYHTNLGAIYNLLGEHQKACDALRKAIQRDKKCAESYYNLGIAQRKLKQNAMAVSAYKEAIKLNPSMAEAYQNLGNAYVDMGNLQMAIVNFKKALELKPNFTKARNGLEAAEVLYQQNKAATNPFGRLMDTAPATAVTAAVIGRELTEEERWEERALVRQLAEEIERIARGCVEYLKQRLHPAVLEVERATAQEGSSSLPEASHNFREATNQWMSLRRSLKRKVEELRTHEQFIATPLAKS